MDGSRLEDDGKRGFNHFHDPTKDESLAGLRDGVVVKGESAARWAREGRGNFYDLRSFRAYYQYALTSHLPDSRLKAMANLSRTTGQLLHLVEDMGVPAHTRNDLYPGHTCSFALSWVLLASTTENYLRKHPEHIRKVTTAEIPTLPRFEDYFDTGLYRAGGLEPVSGLGVGLAEYVNGNFLSEGTTFSATTDYQNPSMEDTYAWFEQRDGQIDYPEVSHLLPRYYHHIYLGRNSADPERRIGHLGAASYWVGFNSNEPRDLHVWIDDACRAEYMDRLAPKAVAYASGLLGHLFRVDLDFSYDTARKAFVIRNLGKDDLSGGFSFLYDRDDGTRAFMPGGAWTLSIPAGGTVVTAAVTLPRDIDLDQTVTLFFSGRAGAEAGIPGGRVRKLLEYEFKVQTRREYESLLQPYLGCNNVISDDPTSIAERCSSRFYTENRRTPWTMFRKSTFWSMLKTTPELARRLHMTWSPDQWVQVWTYKNLPGLDLPFAEKYEIAVSPTEWKVIYDATGAVPDYAWSGVGTPLQFLEGVLHDDEVYLAYRSLHSYTNTQGLCEPIETWGSAPDISITFSARRDLDTGVITELCDNFDDTQATMMAIFQTYLDFFNIFPALMEPYAEIFDNPGWEKYGFRVRLKQLRVLSPRQDAVLVLDRPVTLVKPWGRNIIEAY